MAGLLQEIARHARIAQALCDDAETKQVCIEIGLAARCSLEGLAQREAKALPVRPHRKSYTYKDRIKWAPGPADD